MKGILIEPGRDPEPANLPDTLSAMETRLGGTVEHYIFPRTPAVLFFRTAGQPRGARPASLRHHLLLRLARR